MQRFLVDLMLMRQGRWLRLLGQDVALPEEEYDAGLQLQAKREGRTIITRDKGLFQACPGTGASCLLIRSSKISEQLLGGRPPSEDGEYAASYPLQKRG